MASAVAPQLLGEVDDDGFVNVQDALLVLQHSVGIVLLNPIQRVSANVTYDEIIDATDALYIVQYSVGLHNSFPAMTPGLDAPSSKPTLSKPDTPAPSQLNDPVSSESGPPIPYTPDDSLKVVKINSTNFPDDVISQRCDGI